MKHLTPSEFVDLLDGRLDRERARHAESCEWCGAQMEGLRGVLDESAAVAVPEPPPEFWERLSEDVRDGVTAAAADRLSGLGWLRSRPHQVAAAVAAVALVSGIAWKLTPPPAADEPSRPAPVLGAVEAGRSHSESATEEAWEEVRAAAETVGWAEAQEVGILARPDAAETAIWRLSDKERQQLMALIEEELKRSGA